MFSQEQQSNLQTDTKREPSNSVEVSVIITGYVYGVMVCILTKLIKMYFLMCTIPISFFLSRNVLNHLNIRKKH